MTTDQQPRNLPGQEERERQGLRDFQREKLLQIFGKCREYIEDTGDSRKKLMVYTVAGIVLGIFAVLALVGTVCDLLGWTEPHSLIVLAVYLAAAVAIARWVWKVTLETYDAVFEVPPETVRLGETIRYGVTITTKRRTRMGAARFKLRCFEYAYSEGGNGGHTDTHDIFLYEENVGHEQSVPGYSVAEFMTELEIPIDAVPTGTMPNHKIKWTAQIGVAVRGICLDVFEDWPLQVLAEVPDDALGGPDERSAQTRARELLPQIPQPKGTPLNVDFVVEDAPISENVPILRVGREYTARIRLTASQPLNCRQLLYTIECKVRGSGTRRKIDPVVEDILHEGELAMGETAEREFALRIPQDGPVTYHGKHVKFDWVASVRVDVPIWRDRRFEAPFIVVPGVAQS